MIQMCDIKTFFKYVFPSILSFALSGVYAIVDGFFVGNSLGDVGLSAVNIAYPIVAFIQAVGTGLGMGGAIYYSIYMAEKKEHEAGMFTAGALWLMLASSAVLTVLVLLFCNPILRLLGAGGNMLTLGSVELDLRDLSQARLELHRRYIDIQLLLRGPEETFGWSEKKDCTKAETEFDEAKDIQLFTDVPQCFYTVGEGQFSILFPEDGHAPMLGEGHVKKCIFKVKI